MDVIFNRPVRIGKELHPKSKKAVTIDDKLKDDWFIKALMKSGEIALAPPPDKAAPAKAAK